MDRRSKTTTVLTAIGVVAIVWVLGFRQSPAADDSEARISALEDRVSVLEWLVGTLVSPTPLPTPTSSISPTPYPTSVSFSQDGENLTMSGTGDQHVDVTVVPGAYAAAFTCDDNGSIAGLLFISSVSHGWYQTALYLTSESGQDTGIFSWDNPGPQPISIFCDGNWTLQATPTDVSLLPTPTPTFEAVDQSAGSVDLSGNGQQGFFVTVTPGRYLATFTCASDATSSSFARIYAEKDGSTDILRTLTAEIGKNRDAIEWPEAGSNIVMVYCDGDWTFEAIPIR